MLIVGPSVALVLNFWETLSRIPYFPFFIFVAISSAIYGVGLYAHRRWKLESTSRALLIIGTLLVPLNFLAMAALTKHGQWDPITLLSGVVALALFTWLVGLAAKVLVPAARHLAVLAVVGCSAATFLTALWFGRGSAAGCFFVFGCLPVACFGAAVAGALYQLGKRRRLGPSEAGALFTLLGTGAFSLAVALGLLVANSGDAAEPAGTLDRLSVLLSLAGVPILGGGLAVARGTVRDKALALHHTAGTAIGLVGMLAMLVALCLAWPHPLGIIAAGTINAAALAFAAFYYRMPILHAGAMACAALVYLIGVHVGFGDLPWLSQGQGMGALMLERTVSARSGTALGVLFVGLAAISELLVRRGHSRHGVMYLGGCAVAAVVGLALVTFHGFARTSDGDVLRATILYAVYGAGSLLLVARWRRAELCYLGLSLLAAAPLWAVWWRGGAVGPSWATVLAAEALAMGVIAAVLRRRSSPLGDLYRLPLLHLAETVAGVAIGLGVATAWSDRLEIVKCAWPVLTAASVAALCFLLAWLYRSAERTWAGSIVLLVGLLHTLRFNYTELVDYPWTVGLLAHATVALAAAVLLDAWAGRRGEKTFGETIGRVFGKPLADGALISSAIAVPVLALPPWATATALAWLLLWLAAVWLVLAWRERHPVLFAAHQAALAAGAIAATTAWLQHQVWVKAAGVPRGLFDPRSLQAYGIVLGLLSLVWVVARILLRGNRLFAKLLNPPWPTVDWCIRHAVIWLQLALAVRFLLPGVTKELVATAGNPTAAPFGASAWLLLAVLAAVMIAALWERWREAELVGSLLLAAAIPCLIAGRFVAPDWAVASALRWGAALAFIVCSLAVWNRSFLRDACSRLGTGVKLGTSAPRIARATLLATTALPVVLLTLEAAVLQFGGAGPGGPASGFFHQIGQNASYVVPLLLVILGLVGYAVRERSGGYAFSAGLVTELAVTLGYTLSIVTNPKRSFDVEELITLVQLFAITAAAWAAVWLTARRWLNIWREEPTTRLARVLWNVQLGMGAAGNVLVIVPALLLLGLVGPELQYVGDWIAGVGNPLGWTALISVAAVYVYRRIQLGQGPRPHVIGLLEMTVLGLLACSVAKYLPDSPEWGYRTLMLGWAVYSLLVVAATWWVAGVKTAPGALGPPQAIIRMAAVWVRIAGILAVLLGLKAAVFHESYQELLWAAGAIAVASIAGATMGVWRRREGWAFAAALGVNLAASLVVWYSQWQRGQLDFDEWWTRLLQYNVIASAAVTLAWLAVRRRLYQLRELSLGESPLLTLQTLLPIVGNFALLLGPVAWLVHQPSYLPQWMTELAQVPGWLALLLTAVAAGWYLRRAYPGSLLHVLGALGLGAGVLLCCRTINIGDRQWMEYHTLITAWAALGLLILLLGFVGRNLRLSTQGDKRPWDASPTATSQGEASLSPPGRPLLSAMSVQVWVSAVGAAAVALAVLWSNEDPAGTWWRLRAVVSVSVTLGVLAIWLRLPSYVFVSGLLLNVAGSMAWQVWSPGSLLDLAMANVVCLAAGSIAWLLLGLASPQAVPHVEVDGRPWPFAHLAARLAMWLLSATVATLVFCNVVWQQYPHVGRLQWFALGTAGAALAICLWDRHARFVLPELYTLGLSAMGMIMCASKLPVREFAWAASTSLAGYVLVAAVIGWLLPRLKPVRRALRIPEQADDRPAAWFSQIQAPVAVVAAALCAWVSLDFANDGLFEGVALFNIHGRWGGAPGGLMLLGAAILMAWQTGNTWRARWQFAAMASGVLLTSCIGWAMLDAAGKVPWLHRSVNLMVSAAMMTLLAGFGLRKVLPRSGDWITRGQQAVPALGGLALVMLAAVLVQDVVHWSPGGTPMAWQAIVVVAVTLAALAAGCIGFAVQPQWDPLKLSLRGRTVYVYAAEGLLALMGLHIWLTKPRLFQLGIIRQYWMFIVLAVAFAGVGLAEWFRRRKLPVLCEPLEWTALLLPLVPAVGFWLPFVPQTSWALGLAGRTPVLWFLIGLFYGVMAVNKRSVGLSALAIFTGNMGLWVLLQQRGWDFWDHPQLWLIPIALAVLVAEQLDRKRLNDSQRVAIRYFALSVVYVSSTTEFFRFIGAGGIGAVIRPLVLAVLSVLGVLFGILLRIRSFVYLGVTFLAVVIVRLIYYGAFEEGYMWILWSCLILLGLAIIALFAVFEKRRNDVLAAVESFKDWEK